MTAAYYAQWDSDDLNAWQGIGTDTIQENELTEEDIGLLKIEQDFSPCLEDYGMSWRDFM